MRTIKIFTFLCILFNAQIFLFGQTKTVNKHGNYYDLITSTMTAVKLPGNINSPYEEIGPIPSLDGKTIYYSRHHDPQNLGGKDDEDIWYSEWDSINNHWGDAKDMGAPLNNKYANFINSISPDGDTMFIGNIYNPDGTMGPGISKSHKTPTGWSFPRALIIGKDSKQPAVSGCHSSDDQKILLLAYDHRRNGYGSEDLYVSFLKTDNNWSEPINLGKKINTINIETAPFLADDNKTLFFTSDRPGGLGGKDIYVSERLDETWTKWSDPKNLGPVINNKSDQSFFYVSSHFIFFTSEGEKEGNQDIYSIALPQQTKTAETPTSNPVATSTTAPESETKTVTENLTGTTIRFELNQCVIDGNTSPELVSIVKLLKEKTAVKIEIAGHADDIGSDNYNLALSKRRTDCVFNYLKSQGIDSNRMSVKNYGESKPLNKEQTEEARAQNRRVEILVKGN